MLPRTHSANTPARHGSREATIVRAYEERLNHAWREEFYEGSQFANFGFWDFTTRTQKDACENLMEKLLEFIPDKQGPVLDVACGNGATTRHLLRYYRPDVVTGINISEPQLRTCREIAPDCQFLRMSATRMEFYDATFEAVLCVEAAFHFETREAFLQEAYRVLKPGGYLVLSDILAPRWVEHSSPMLVADNHVENPVGYADLLEDFGFESVHVVDATGPCFASWYAHITAFFREKLRQGRVSPAQFRRIMLACVRHLLSVTFYVLASARKPVAMSR